MEHMKEHFLGDWEGGRGDCGESRRLLCEIGAQREREREREREEKDIFVVKKKVGRKRR